jgi:hypothetical protein
MLLRLISSCAKQLVLISQISLPSVAISQMRNAIPGTGFDITLILIGRCANYMHKEGGTANDILAREKKQREASLT